MGCCKNAGAATMKKKSFSNKSSPAPIEVEAGLSPDVLAQLGESHTVIQAASTIDAVTVYSSLAEIIRIVDVPATSSGIIDLLVRVTASADRDSLRVEPVVPGSCKILDVSSDSSRQDMGESDRVKALRGEVDAMDAQLLSLESAFNRVLERGRWFDNYAKALMPHEGQNGLPLDRVDEFLQSWEARVEEMHEKKAALKREIDAKKKEIKDKKEEIKDQKALDGDMGGVSVLCTVTVLVPEGADGLGLRLSYNVRDCSWSSSYDCRVQRDADAMQLVYFGNVKNNTGEHWQKVKLALSTAQPQSGGAPPKMFTKRVTLSSHKKTRPQSISNPMYHANMMQIPQQQMMLPAALSNALIESDSELSVSECDIDGETPMFDDGDDDDEAASTQDKPVETFVVSGQKTILSDGKSHKVTVLFLDLVTRFTYTAVPAAGRVFLRGSATNGSSPLLAGPMAVFLGSSFVCNVALKTTAPKQEFNVFLGGDDKVVLRVLPTVEHERSIGMFKKEKVKNTKRVHTLHNLHDKPIVIALFDQLPLSDSDSVKVKVLEPSDLDSKTAVAKINEHNNIRWSFELGAGEKKEIKFEYEITYPGDQHISISEW